MFEDAHDTVAVFDFDELADHLLEQGLDISPGRLHGCLCGLLAAGAPGQAEAGLALLSQAENSEFHGELAALTMQLYTVTAAALEDEEFDFYPLLPADEVEIESRTRELANWCTGFLSGFALVNQRPVGQDSGEILRDLAVISEAAVDEEADEEESEGSFTEILEYVRFAALNIFVDTRTQAAETGEQSLH